MPRHTAVIDIGSNSARLVIYQKTSRYGFHLLAQHKSRVRIGEGAYRQGGVLQPEPMERAFRTLESFRRIIAAYGVRTVRCVATSALRDAPNQAEFVTRVRKHLQIDIRVIDGQTEAMYGAIAASNLLPIRDAVTIDIGGGSTDMARIVGGKVVETFSLDLGTVRLKELFSGRRLDRQEAQSYIDRQIQALPESFRSSLGVGIGGSARALAKGIMEATAYPLDKLHAFAYRYRDHRDYIDAIIESDLDDLGDYAIKPERFDTIREGALILDAVVRRCGIRRIVTSGVGVREGVYLASRLRRDGMRFPAGINPSIRSIRDRFDIVTLPAGHRRRHGRQLFDLLQKRFGGDRHDRDLLMHALSLANTGKMLTIYKEHRHAHCIAEQELNYGFWHEEIITIALLLRSKGMRTYHKELYHHYRGLLPRKKKLKWMVFIYTLTLILYENGVESRIDFGCHKGELSLTFQSAVSYLLLEALQRISVPKGLTIRIEQA